MNYFLRWVKQPYFKVGLFFYLALLLGGAQPAGAAVISASAAINWSSFKITPIDIGQGLPSLIWKSENESQHDISLVETSSSCCSRGNAFDWSTGTLATQSGSNFNASASTSISQLKADASINGFPNQFLYAKSESQRFGDFTVQGNGILLFQANYSLAGDVGIAPEAFAFSEVSIGASIDGGRFGGASQSVFRSINTGDQPFAKTGILSTPLVIRDGWNGTFGADALVQVNSNNVLTPIPLPAAFWLFGSALAGVAAFRRLNIWHLTCTG